jgi:uncharacterized protein Yka (UPF0111/DUF47 family)
VPGLAEAFETLEERYPPLDTLATRPQLSETERHLHKEIERMCKDIKEVEDRADLFREAHGVLLLSNDLIKG